MTRRKALMFGVAIGAVLGYGVHRTGKAPLRRVLPPTETLPRQSVTPADSVGASSSQQAVVQEEEPRNFPDTATFHIADLQGDDAKLARLVRDLDAGKAGAAAVLKAERSTLLPRLMRLQRAVPATSQCYHELAQALAYLGRDRRRNVAILRRPVELWSKGEYDRLAEIEANFEAGDPMEFAIASLAWLYRQNRDPALAEVLFSWGLDGCPAECLDVTRVDLLTEAPLDVLRMLRRSAKRADAALDALGNGVGAGDEEYRRALASIRLAAQRADPALRRYARRFLRQAEWRRRVFEGEKNLRGADLEGADVYRYLEGTDLRDANLRGAHLEDNDLRDANLRGADLRGAHYNKRTRWPSGVNARKRGAAFVK